MIRAASGRSMTSRDRGARRRSTRSRSWWPRSPMTASPRPGWGSRTGRPGSLAAGLGISFASVADLAQVSDPAAPDRDLQVQHRPGAGGEDPRCRRPVPRAAGQRGRRFGRREKPGSGPGPDGAKVAPEAGPGRRAGTPRLARAGGRFSRSRSASRHAAGWAARPPGTRRQRRCCGCPRAARPR